MKVKLILSLCLCLIIGSCSEDEDPGEQFGCFTGIHKSDTERVLVFCSKAKDVNEKKQQPYVKNYTDYRWEPAKNCKECEDKWQ